MPKHSPDYWRRELTAAECLYGDEYTEPPNWARPFIGLLALLVYGLSVSVATLNRLIFEGGNEND